jgi:hypothetical protein
VEPSIEITSQQKAADHSALEELIKSFPPITSIKQLEVQVKAALKNPWDISLGDNLILLPKNYQELYKDNYLVTLFLSVINLEKIDIQVSERDYTSRLKMTPSNETFLKSFGILPLTGKIPEIPNQKGNIWKGIASSVRIWLLGQEKVDMSLFRIGDAPHPADVLFGDVWGTNYPVEKRMLDHIIHFIRTKVTDSNGIRSYLKPRDQIIHAKGLNLDLESDMISSVELVTIRACLNLQGIEEKSTLYFTNYNNDLSAISQICQQILERQKKLKGPKDIIKGIISDRITATFQPYQGREREKAKKIPIKNLIEKVKNTEHFRAFNPTRFISLIGMGPLPSTLTQKVNAEFLHVQKTHFGDECEKRGLKVSLISSLIQEYDIFLKDNQISN